MTNHLSPLFASHWSTIRRPGQIDLAEPEKAAPEPVTAVQLEAAMRLAYFAGVRACVGPDERIVLNMVAMSLEGHADSGQCEIGDEANLRHDASVLRALAGKATP